MKTITPGEAYIKARADAERSFIVDVRTQAEYEFVGHPSMAYNIPYEYWTPEGNEKNPRFVENASKHFSRTDTLMILCRSGKRSPFASEELERAGFQNIFDVSEGFEGPILADENSIYCGCRGKVSGWQHAGLPYTYDIDPLLAYNDRE